MMTGAAAADSSGEKMTDTKTHNLNFVRIEVVSCHDEGATRCGSIQIDSAKIPRVWCRQKDGW